MHVWEQKENDKAGTEELIILNQPRKKYAGARHDSL